MTGPAGIEPLPSDPPTDSPGRRVRRRLDREVRALAPLVDVARAHPLARRARRSATGARIGLQVRLGDPDRLLDRIVDRALDAKERP
jgi:hypothetical protein